jgi:butyryl-CoA dehydrogenase
MDFALTAEQELLRQTVREFCEKELREVARTIDRSHEFPRKTVTRMAELGLLGMPVPPEYGGAGADYVSFGLVAEELARVSATHAVIFGANNSLTCGPIMNWGTEEQKRKFLVPLAQGKHLGAYALSEPHAGSDAASLSTTATREGDSYRINGQKTFITNGSVADTTIVFATVDKSKGPKGITAFIVPKGTKGLQIGEDFEKMGLNGSATTPLLFDDMVVPAEYRLGAEGEGFKIAMATLDTGRIMAAAGSVGLARGALEDSVAYTKQRIQFEVPIIQHQMVQHTLADMATGIEAGRMLYLKAAHLKDLGKPYTMEASMAKLFASEMAMAATIKGIQMHGGNGYIRDYDVERYFRDIKIFEIFEGTSEIQRLVISRHLGL